jgi:hypothetical protein
MNPTSKSPILALAALGAAMALCGSAALAADNASQSPRSLPLRAKINTQARDLLSNARTRQPMGFEPNVGQTDKSIAFVARGRDYTVALSGAGGLWQHTAEAGPSVGVSLLGANPHPILAAEEPLQGVTNYMSGADRSKWHTDIPNYARVKYREVYPGVDVVYHSNQGQLEYDFEIAPGGDPKQIRLRFDGVQSLEIDAASGDLVVTKKGSTSIRHTRPQIYQSQGSQRVTVQGTYRLLGARTAAFTVGNYDHSRALIIDPTVVVTQFIEGNYNDQPFAITVDVAGNAYIAGITESTRGFLKGNPNQYYPLGKKSCDPTKGQAGWRCPNSAFLLKLRADGTMLAMTLFGGTGFTVPNAITVDPYDVYVVGGTTSPDVTDAGGTGVGGTTYSTNTPVGVMKSFAAKFTSNTYLWWVTTLGGDDVSAAHGIAVDSTRAMYITGATCGSGFPTSELVGRSSFQPTAHGGCDAYVTKIDAFGFLNGGGYSTYLGGQKFDEGDAIAVDATGSAWVTGQTCSADYPVTNAALNHGIAGAFGGCTAFVTELAPDGSFERYSLLLGGQVYVDSNHNYVPPYDTGSTIVLNGSNGVYVGGSTYSPNFYTTPGAVQPNTPCGPVAADQLPCESGWLAYVNAGAIVQYSTYLGGTNSSHVNSIARNNRGEVYAGGVTTGYEGFPGAPAITPNPSAGYVTKLSGALDAVQWTRFLGAEVTGIVDYVPNTRFGRLFQNYVYTTGWRVAPAPTAGDDLEDGFMVKISDPPIVVVQPRPPVISEPSFN